MCYCVAVKSLNLIVELAVTSLCIWNNELGGKLFFPTSYINWSVFISCCLFLYCVNLVFTGTLLIGMTAGKVAFDKLTKSTLVISTK